MNDLLGLYRHYKGGRYLVTVIAETRDHNGDLDVVYIPLQHGKHVTCPLRRDSRDRDAWLDLVAWPDGKQRHRFTKESALAMDGTLSVLEQLWQERK